MPDADSPGLHDATSPAARPGDGFPDAPPPDRMRGAAGALTGVRVCDRPCGSCSWRVDNAGRFAYDNLPDYAAGTIPGEPDFGQPDPDDPLAPLGILFGCHRHSRGDMLCAGHVAVVGADHPLIRLGIGLGLIDPAVLTPGADWPALHPDYAAMLAATGHGPAR